MKRHWIMNRLLVSYVPIIFSVCTVLVLLLVVGFNQLSREASRKESRMIAQYVMAAIDHELVEIEAAADTELLNKSRFMRLFQVNPTKSAYKDVYEMSVLLREMKFKYPGIDSVYVYRYADRTVQSMHGAVALDKFGDRAFVEEGLRMKGRDELSWGNIRTFKEFANQPASEVVSLVRSVPLLTKEGGLLVINMSTDYLRGVVGHLTDLNNSYVAVSDPEGRRLLEAGTSGIASDTVYESTATGYTVRLGFREGVLYTIVNTTMSVYVVIGIVVLLLGIGWAVFTTHRTYRPVHSLMSRLSGAAGSRTMPLRKERVLSEFRYVDQMLDGLIDRSAQFERQQQENAAYRKRMLYASLREGHYEGTPEQLQAQLSDFGWIAGDGYMVAVLEIDRFEAFTATYTARDQSLLKYAINNVIMDISQHGGHPSPWADWLSGNRIALLYPVNREGGGTNEAVVNGLDEAVRWIDRHLKTTVSVGVGSPVWDATGIGVSYEEALHMLNLTFSLGTNRIIGHWEVEPIDRSGYLELLAPTRELAREFCQARPEWPDRLDDWVGQVAERIAVKEDFDRLTYSLIYYFRLEASQLPAELQAIWREEYDSRLERTVQTGRSGPSIRDVGSRLRELLEEVDGRFAAVRERSGYYDTMQEIRAYIDRHYADPDLSLELLSSRFELNPKAVSRLFKEQFGINFVDYLIKTRIEQSKRLLLESDEPIQSISRRVGYLNALSFTRAFKKMEGITPVDLRRA